MSSGLGRTELEFVTFLTAPLFWVIREGDGHYRVRNGSAFFLDAGQGPFGVTANHVLQGLTSDAADGSVVAVQIDILPLVLAGKNRVIASRDQLDIATFRITPAEIARIGKTALTGFQRRWPPLLPDFPAPRPSGPRRVKFRLAPRPEAG